MPLASGPSSRAVMIEETKPVRSSSMPAAAFITEFAIIPFDIYPSVSIGLKRVTIFRSLLAL
ncbi:hypothetical protein GCM10008012_45380 [Rhizobium anhuiense]|nr:hypothetical protein GCM10008012_45380 [Rhizobium anhuiense]